MQRQKPKVLIVDRSLLDGRVLEVLLRPVADVNVKSNVWTAVKCIDSERNRLSAIFVEIHLLLSSSISEHWMKSLQGKNHPKIIVTHDDSQIPDLRNLKRYGVMEHVRKPYDGRVLMPLVQSLTDEA